MNPTPVIPSHSFGQLSDGRPARLFTLQLPNGLQADITEYGGTLVRLLVPDRTGRLDDVVLGFNSVGAYEAHSSYFGCLVGRFANRIGGGRFQLEGRTHQLATNNVPAGRPCHLHGGPGGFHRALWSATPIAADGQPALRLNHLSPDGDEGYPGNLSVTVVYTLRAPGDLVIDYQATCDRPTPLNLTHHAYFDLHGEGRGDILDHELTLRASRFTPVDAGQIPTGELAPVAGTPFDFRSTVRIGKQIVITHPQLANGGGFDHNFVLDAGQPTTPALAAVVFEAQSGRRMEVLTTEPGIQFYSGNFLDGTLTGKSGHAYAHRSALCLETQHFPDSPNQPAFPDTILRPGQVFRSSTIYRFSTG